jgi:hypothetical protein
VSQQMERRLHDYYGWDPYRGDNYFGMGAMVSPLSPSSHSTETAAYENADIVPGLNEGDPHLRSHGCCHWLSYPH